VAGGPPGIIDRMPSRKQRRRRQKLQRHEYEYVVETEEGEVPLESPRAERRAERDPRDREPLDRRGRPVPKPSLQRVRKRSAIFTPILALFVYVSGREDLSTPAIVVNVALLLAFFIPFSYMVDVFVYRMMLRRAQRR
jgi:hypothetical protein